MTAELVMDRRVRRSQRALQEALVELVLESSYNAVTVEQIISRADVSRATFYAHYASKDLLLEAVMARLWRDLGSQATAVGPTSTTQLRGAVLVILFKHAEAHADLYRVVFSGAGDGSPLRTFAKTMIATLRWGFEQRAANLGVEPRQSPEFLARMLAAEVIAAMTWWLWDPTAPGPDDLIIMLLQRNTYGDAWAHGFDDGVLSVDVDAIRLAFERKD